MDHKTTTANTESAKSADTASPLVQKLGMAIIYVTAESSELTMPVDGNTQIHGILHGGATAALCETAASLAATAHAQSLSATMIAVGSELSISHVRAGQGHLVTARATAVYLGKTSTVHEVLVTDEKGRSVSSARVTNRLLQR